MKKTISILVALLGMCLFVSCGGSSKGEKASPLGKQIQGEWRLSSWNGAAPTEFDAYIALNADRTFVIYQKIETSNYQKFSGSYQLSGNVLSGVYSDKVPWGAKYQVAYDEGTSKMTLTSDSATAEVSVYVKASIPADVKSGSITVNSVRSELKRLL